jgi:hypothetical protein
MKSIFVLLGLFFSFVSYAEEILYCNSEVATGFIREDGNWTERHFKPASFSIQAGENFKYFKIEGRKFICHNPYDDEKETLVCERDIWANGLSFRYSKKTNRFIYIRSSVSGYIEDKEITDMEIMYAGRCGVSKRFISPLTK